MEPQVVLGLLVAVGICALADGQCFSKPLNAPCEASIECASRYCVSDYCMNFGVLSDEQGLQSPCVGRICPAGQTCVVEQRACIYSPCPGRGVCVDTSSC